TKYLEVVKIKESRSCLVIFFSCMVSVPTKLNNVEKSGFTPFAIVFTGVVFDCTDIKLATTCENLFVLVFFAFASKGFNADCISFSRLKPMSELVGLLNEVIFIR